MSFELYSRLSDDRDAPFSVLSRRYEADMGRAAAAQFQLKSVLSLLIREYSVRRIYAEGIAPNQLALLNATRASVLTNGDEDLAASLLRGAVLSLFYTGELEELGAIEDPAALIAHTVALARPQFSPVSACEAREDAIVKNLLRARGTVIVVLGGAHDLSDNIERLAVGDCQYIRVWTDGYIEADRRARHDRAAHGDGGAADDLAVENAGSTRDEAAERGGRAGSVEGDEPAAAQAQPVAGRHRDAKVHSAPARCAKRRCHLWRRRPRR